MANTVNTRPTPRQNKNTVAASELDAHAHDLDERRRHMARRATEVVPCSHLPPADQQARQQPDSRGRAHRRVRMRVHHLVSS
jgi:hypothetical protein